MSLSSRRGVLGLLKVFLDDLTAILHFLSRLNRKRSNSPFPSFFSWFNPKFDPGLMSPLFVIFIRFGYINTNGSVGRFRQLYIGKDWGFVFSNLRVKIHL